MLLLYWFFQIFIKLFCVVVMVLNTLHMKAGEMLVWDVVVVLSRMFLIRCFLLSGCLLAVEVRP